MVIFAYVHQFAQQSPVQSGFGSTDSLLFVIALFGFVFVRRIIAATRGRRFTSGRVVMLPIVYTLLTIFLIVPLEYTHPLLMFTLLAIAPGFGVGYVFGKRVHFFMKHGEVYYRRSPVVMSVWLGSAIARLLLFYGFTGNTTVDILVDTTLVFTTGMLVGESIHILRGRKAYTGDAETAPDDDYGLMKEI